MICQVIFLHKLCKFGGGIIKTDIVLHPYLLITQRGTFKIYIFLKYFKKDGGEWRFLPFFEAKNQANCITGKLGWLPASKKCGNRGSRTKSVSPGIDASI